MGRLTRDPEVRNAQNLKIAKFTLAVDRRFRGTRQEEQTADFIRCTAFSNNAEFVEKWLRQGKKIVVIGRLESDTYTNREGQKVYSIEVVVEEIEFAESKSAEEGRRQSPSGSQRSTTGYHNSQGRNSNVGDGFMSIPDGIDEELPFH